MTAISVLVAHHDPQTLDRLTSKLSDRGYHVVGPARTAGAALALAAQAPVAMALVGERLAGRRNGADLIRALRATWGVRSFLLRDAPQAA
jgi:ActR/RegA family two-component response regulator